MLDILDAAPQTATGTFFDLLQDFRSAKSVGTDDLLAAVLPLMEQVRRQHDQDFVAPLDGVDQIQLYDDRVLWFNVVLARPEAASNSVLKRIDTPESDGLEVTDELDVLELNDGMYVDNKRIADRGQEPDRPMYFLDYTTWEMAAGQHDALADIFALGMIMGSLATGLDFSDRGELQKFLQHRRNIHAYNNRIHPVVSKIIRHMTELKREERAQDLAAIIETLDDYRHAETDDFEDRLARLEAIKDPGERRLQIQDYLRNRLFEISRRNRMLYFKETSSSANLTVGSLPFTIDHRSIRTGDLIVTNERFTRALERLFRNEGRESWLPLKQYLRFEDYPFLAPKIDKIRLQAQADKKEYGFSQLRLVLAFLRWHNLSRDQDTRIHSPLILVPLDMRKQRGTEDGYEISPTASLKAAEINPVLRHQLREIYGIELDETIDVTRAANIKALQAQLEEGIQRRHAGVTIHSVTKPRIQLIRRTVIRQLEDFNRRTKKSGRGLKDYGGLAYSYDRDNYAPLGLALFDQQIRVRPAPGRELIGAADPLADEVKTKPGGERQTTGDFYSIDQGEESDPLNWEIDLTSVTLSNFNYRKMSLVRDYAELRNGQGGTHANFDRLFTRQARPLGVDYVVPGYAHRYSILPCDPSQERAVLQARDRESYVIQGPPGTGKSQTIANLLADYAARGRKVLFVCEKRVALDVVFHRLADAGLGELTTLIHDTKDDKRGFLSELKEVYEAWRQARPKSALHDKRAALIEEIEGIIGQLEDFSKLMTGSAVGSDVSVRGIIARAVQSNAEPIGLGQAERELLPTWNSLQAVEEVLAEIDHIASSGLPEGLTPQALVGRLNSNLAQHDAVLNHLNETVHSATMALDEAAGALDQAVRGDGKSDVLLGEIIAQSELAQRLSPLVKSSNLKLLEDGHPDRQRFVADEKRLRMRELELLAQESGSKWHVRPDKMEVKVALAVARRREDSFLAFLYGDWRRLKRWVAQSYDGQVLSYSALLSQILQQISDREAYELDARTVAEDYGVENMQAIGDVLKLVSDEAHVMRDCERKLINLCLRDELEARRAVLALAGKAERLQSARRLAALLFRDGGEIGIDRLRSDLKALSDHTATAASLLPQIARLETSDPKSARAWRDLGLGKQGLESATLLETLSRSFATAPTSARMTGETLGALTERLEAALNELRVLNAQTAIETNRENFQRNLKLFHSGEVAQDQQRLSDAYRKGCEVLEHQFGLTRPSKSLRELLTDDPGEVLRDLKPIWMMSPLSVADTLPFTEDLFDAVIFDEASQIPLEDAIPSLYRAKQTIIVGDEMQLPPTSFFSSSGEGEETLPDYLAYAVSADSLLTKAAGTLASTRLNWHYRSRHESLISFCNRAFYGGTLNTVPGRAPLRAAPELVLDAEQSAKRSVKEMAQALRDRQISFHRIKGGVYRNQRNEAEAEYMAELVRAHIKGRSGQSLGVVAFSQTQAQAIEAAIDLLAATDRDFARRLEEESEREIDGQFAGLFVKNLENVQGDERDIILISVGYAPGPDGRMRMNFGPINQAGGEKRLNVIFSRAKHHIGVVSSIDAAQITNDYNTGANTLKQYLRYAAAVSRGDPYEMEACLDGLSNLERGSDNGPVGGDPVIDHVARKLESEGMAVHPAIGHSALRIDLAVRRPEEDDLTRAIIVDTPAQYAVSDTAERYVTRPAVFRAFGWQVEQVFGKDFVRVDN